MTKVLKRSPISQSKTTEEEEAVEEVVGVIEVEEAEVIEGIEVVDLTLPQEQSKPVEKKLELEEADLKAQESTQPRPRNQPKNELGE